MSTDQNTSSSPSPDSPAPELVGAQQLVKGGTGEMFDQIAGRYDLLNRILSLGQDQYWRRKAVKALALKPGDRVLDVATGTGDLAILIARMVPGTEVQGVDPSVGMISLGRVKIVERSLERQVALFEGDGQALQYPDASFAGAVVAFGIRNFPDRFRGLCEMRRVTRPGGKVVILELSEPRRGPLAWGARTYIHHVVPVVGSVLSGKREYRYLQRSIEAFPEAGDFAQLMREAGLEAVRWRPLSFGAVNLFEGSVPQEA